MAKRMTGGKGRVSGAVKMKLGAKAPKQGKVGGISTPFSNRVMTGGKR